MYCVRQIASDTYWIGGSDRRLALFENVYPIPSGVSYNSYLVKDEKTVLLDTVDKSVEGVFLENLAHVLAGASLDYIVVNHMEPDHSASLATVARLYPQAKIVCTAKAVTMIKQYSDIDIDSRAVVVKDGDALETGNHKFAFVTAPMVHWPEVMVTFDTSNGVLFSADAFGSFGAINGAIFADEVNFDRDYLNDFRRYYTNIVGKYGVQVQALLKKAAALPVKTVCPLHGLIWRDNLSYIIDKYNKWSTYEPEEKGVMIAYASVYGNTENAVDILAAYLAEKGVKNITVYDVSVTHPSYIVSEAFRYSHLVFASTTYNMGIFVNMENVLHDITAHGLKNRAVALIENGSWAPAAGNLMNNEISKMKDMRFISSAVTVKSSVKCDTRIALENLAAAIASDLQSDN